MSELTPQGIKLNKSPTEDIQSLFEPQMLLTLASHVQAEVFHQPPALWETVCVTFLVNRHGAGKQSKVH